MILVGNVVPNTCGKRLSRLVTISVLVAAHWE